jgi:hypothetical protein
MPFRHFVGPLIGAWLVNLANYRRKDAVCRPEINAVPLY